MENLPLMILTLKGVGRWRSLRFAPRPIKSIKNFPFEPNKNSV
jgi:hypothetical protein